MDGDELLILVLSAGAAIAYWARWYAQLVRLQTLSPAHPARLLLPLTHLVCVLLLLLVLTTAAAAEVRHDPAYLALFVAGWAVALAAVNVWGNVLGISALHDAVERRNAAAAWAVAGAWLATTLCACGANIGEGPTIYTTLGPLALAVAALAVCWLLFAVATRNGTAVAVDRDRASGVRLAGLLVAWGLVLGRAVAGDWVSAEATLRDFGALGWPALALLAAAAALEPAVRPNRARPFPDPARAGVVPAAAYLAAATAWLAGVR
jgi:hypothetical protein